MTAYSTDQGQNQGAIPVRVVPASNGFSTTPPWYATNGATPLAAASATLVASAGVGLKNYITGIQLSNSSATATLVTVSTSSTVLWSQWIAGSTAAYPVSNTSFSTPLQSLAATSLTITSSAAGALYYNVQGYQSA